MRRSNVALLYLATLLASCSGSRSEPGDPVAAPLPTPTGKGILLLTTNQIRASSSALDRYVEAKMRRNFRVQVVTEDQYGGESAERGWPRAQRIRSWLQSHRADYSYLLVVGDAHPDHGDVPMITVWPRHEMPADLCGNAFVTDCRTCLTDGMYADLTGDWDLNRNGHPGETGLDDGPGGIDFQPELVVGRLPVYFGDGSEADRILEHTMEYMDQTKQQASYRRSVLLPAALFYVKGQALANSTAYATVDGASTAEWFLHNVLASRSSFSYTRMYEMEGIVPSTWPSDVALNEDNLAATWSQGYGVIFWMGHGLQREVGRVVWNADANSNGIPENTEMSSPLFLRSVTLERVTPGKPGFVVAVSCEVGNASNPYHLAQSALLNGAAIGVIGSSGVTPGDGTVYDKLDSPMDQEGFGATNAGIEVIKAILDGKPPAEGFASARVSLGTSGNAEAYAGKMMLNYFGDPTLTIDSSIDDVVFK
ncbi:MAG: hypothetical protein HY898_09140 [Deltaproteobacteria bacterium]|nr:hypothetical protein [Deltaproteobacteria bacterium]